ncbi:MAG: transcription-repair coupling factor [Chloroflexota bacterium]
MELDLTKLLDLIEEMPAFRGLITEIKQENGAQASVLDSAKPYLIAALYQKLGRPVLLVTAQPENTRKLYEQISTWYPSSQIKLFPEPDALPYERMASDTSTELERLQVLSALTEMVQTPLIITSAPALMQKVISFNDFKKASHVIEAGTEIEPLKLIELCQDIGYDLESTVEIPGTMSHRGGIIDIFSPASELPARLEFFGNTIESIRLFDPSDQKSLKPVPFIEIIPATEMVATAAKERMNLDMTGLSDETRNQFEQELAQLLNREKVVDWQFYAPLFNNDSVLSYIPQNALLILDEPRSISETIADLQAKAEEVRTDKIAQHQLPCNFPASYFTWEDLEERMKTRQSLRLTAWDTTVESQSYKLNFAPVPNYAGQLPTFIKKAKELLVQKQRLIIVSHQAKRLSELLQEEDMIAPPLTEVKQVPPPGSLTLLQGLLAEGWTMDGTHLFTDAELFGFIKQHRVSKKHPVPRHKLFVDMTPGDFVVHIDHGIALLAGITKLKTDGIQSEYLVLEYAAGDKLYVPTGQIDRVSRYIGSGEQSPTLSRLGTQEWSQTRQKVEESVAEIAEELLALYAAREVVPGFAFSPDTVWQQELEASFPYIETPDQARTVGEVRADMEKQKPMDRLVCGDVGYGKTEVAIRAAFKAVMDGKQVAVLVPTTVLAEQHFLTFSQRLAAFPMKIEVLSRFRTPREQQTVLEGLANGTVDICIGTHRLIQKDVVFKDLGLLIIDEEQRFGVAHKEYLKKLRREVSVLALSATPIPRTLHMSLVGIRDMSVMETPPEDRVAVKTYVAEYDDRLVREAIIREIERNGQVFFVHNRVESIAIIANKLKTIVPEARIAIGHGQMSEAELERVMADFVQGKSDVLICTTIIESGLDMPNVNTLIVNQADKFGLTQLYQLRGRVGRGTNLAYAYFLYDRGKHITPTAEKRLKTIFEATELGAGFGIAMKDLEIRGAGTLLGVKQSGHISAVGFNLYCQLLAQAVEEQKAKLAGVAKTETSRLPPPTINLPLPAYIPEDYIPNLGTRLGLYQKLVKTEKAEDVEVLAQEFTDRFGAPSPEVNNLLYAVKIKILAAKAGIESISTEDGEVVLRLFEGMKFNKEKLEPLLRRYFGDITLGNTQLRINIKGVGKGWMVVVEEVLQRIT